MNLFRKLLRKEYIPNPAEHLYIENSNICNLGCKICPYRKVTHKKQVMPDQLFQEIIDKATDFRYDKFGLTPLTGEVFTDKDFLKKLDYLENHKKVKEYSFFTNFTLADRESIDFLIDARKLNILSVSLYGHDEDSFVRFTGSNREMYLKLVSNIDYLLSRGADRKFHISIGLRTRNDFQLKTCDSELCKMIKELLKQHKSEIYINKNYNNWGGYITSDDVADLDITINESKATDKKGACALLFYKNIVLADGRINACACRDVDATMIIGDLKKQSFAEIYSIKNSFYMNLIKNQQAGKFSKICRECDFYCSIYSYSPVYRKHRKKPVTLKNFYDSIK